MLQTPPLVYCSAPGCNYNTPMGAHAKIALEFLKIHINMAHPQQVTKRAIAAKPLGTTTPEGHQEEPTTRPRHSWPNTQGSTRRSSVGSGGNLPHFGEGGLPLGPRSNKKVELQQQPEATRGTLSTLLRALVGR